MGGLHHLILITSEWANTGWLRSSMYLVTTGTHSCNTSTAAESSPGPRPTVSQQLKDRHLFGSQVSSQEVHCVPGQVRREDRTRQLGTATTLQYLNSHTNKFFFNQELCTKCIHYDWMRPVIHRCILLLYQTGWWWWWGWLLLYYCATIISKGNFFGVFSKVNKIHNDFTYLQLLIHLRLFI